MNEEREAQIWVDTESGLTVREIAEKHHVSESHVRNSIMNGHPIHTVNEPAFEDTSTYEAPIDWIQRFKQYIVGANAVETAETGEPELTIDQLYFVWFVYVLGNPKALFSTTVAGDGLYFEVTHNKEKEETYVDIYKKQANHVFSHHDY